MNAIGRFERALQVFRGEVKADIKVQHLHMLIALMIHEPEPMSYQDLIKATGASLSGVSRATKILGVDMVQTKKDGPWIDKGLGLVDARPDRFHPRQYVVALTTEGCKLQNKLQKVLN